MCDLSPVANFVSAHLGEFIAGFGGAGFGALTTYLFQKRQEAAALSEKKYTAILESRMVLSVHISSLISMQTMLAPYKGKENPAFIMGLKFLRLDRTAIDLKALSFITYESRNPNLWMDLHLADSRYFNTVEAFDYRNQVYREFSAAATVEAYDPSTKMAGVRADVKKAQLVIDATNALFEFVDNTTDFVKATLIALDATSVELFPDRKAVRFILKEPEKVK